MTCLQIHEEADGDGDVLVFLPGQDDIEALSQLLRENLSKLRAEKSRWPFFVFFLNEPSFFFFLDDRFRLPREGQ